MMSELGLVKILALVLAAALVGSGCGRKEAGDEPDEQPGPDADGEGDGLPAKGSDDPAPEPAGPDLVVDEPVNEAVADFKGFFAIDGAVRDRMLDLEASDQFYLGRYLDSYSRQRAFGLPELLGVETGNGVRSGFRNGKANAVNVVLWHLAVSGLAADVAKVCDAGSPDVGYQMRLSDSFVDILLPLCKQGDDVEIVAARDRLWDEVMAYDAPQEEKDAFLAAFGEDGELGTLSGEGGAPSVRGMMTAIMMNPHFLIRK